ncbi:hypothetical protein OG943_09155 [Amycolatopsis sp. NBC_00345]|uniref:hypothetical protein n=1 Tax=Amycolatopsis sp. NBC_00345 TaxID=2975955 RepID=UPI002E273F85
MSARALPLLATGLALPVALLIAGCSGGSGTSGATSNNASPPAGSSASDTAATSATSEAKPPTKKEGDDAVGRYATYLHAMGNEDVTTACEIGRDAAKKSEDDGFGPCEQSLLLTFQMYSASEKAALQGATVDRSLVTESITQVHIPAEAVKADAELTDTELPEATMELREGKWYLIKW